VGALGAGASHVHAEGSASAPWVTHRGDAWTFAADGGLGGLVRIGERLGIVAEVHAVVLAPGVAVEIGDTHVQARRPMELGTLGLRGTF
jgi:hypothetical protein